MRVLFLCLAQTFSISKSSFFYSFGFKVISRNINPGTNHSFSFSPVPCVMDANFATSTFSNSPLSLAVATHKHHKTTTITTRGSHVIPETLATVTGRRSVCHGVLNNNMWETTRIDQTPLLWGGPAQAFVMVGWLHGKPKNYQSLKWWRHLLWEVVFSKNVIFLNEITLKLNYYVLFCSIFITNSRRRGSGLWLE